MIFYAGRYLGHVVGFGPTPGLEAPGWESVRFTDGGPVMQVVVSTPYTAWNVYVALVWPD